MDNIDYLKKLLKTKDRNNEKTINFYVSNILSLYNQLDKPITDFSFKINKIDEIFKKNKYSLHTCKNKLISLYVYMSALNIKNALFKEIENEIEELNKSISMNYDTHEKNDKEKKQMLSEDDFKKLIQSKRPETRTIKYYNDYRKYIICNFRTCISRKIYFF